MSGTGPTKTKAAGWPLFLRIFAVLLGSLVAFQAMNAILVMVTPPPAPRFFSLDEVERALKGDAGDEFKRVERSDASSQGDGPRERRLQELLASRLGVDRDDVRVNLRRFFGQRRRFAAGGMARNRLMVQRIAGNFEIALRREEGRWVIVSPAGVNLPFWRWRALGALLGALLIAAPIAWWLSRRIARPIAIFGAAAERLGRDPKSPPLEISGPPEVADAAAAFNEMQGRLQRYVADRAVMLGAVAHDLRTPLMRIALHLENAPASIRSTVEGEVEEVQAMLAAVLAFLHDQEQPSRRQRLDFRAIAQSVADGLTDEGHRINLAEGPPLVIEGDPAALKTLVRNLMRNAVVHAGGAADVALGDDSALVWMEVRDRGPGIDEPMLDQMFEPFVRGEASRSRDTGGIGLGLASARNVAQGHGGDVTLANRPGGGLTARVELPR